MQILCHSIMPTGEELVSVRGRASTLGSARRVLEDAISQEAGHWVEHSDLPAVEALSGAGFDARARDHVGVAPVGCDAYAVQLFCDGQFVLSRVFRIVQ